MVSNRGFEINTDEDDPMKRRGSTTLALVCLVLSAPLATADDRPLRDQAAEALRKATAYFRTKVATEGGYLWRYSEDLARREGERAATASLVWVQPPGTPTVGMAFLDAYAATGDSTYRDAARDAAHALVRGQLRSGGWDYQIEFDHEKRTRYAYRIQPAAPIDARRAMNVTTLDDDTTQSAVRLLMRVDRALDFKDAAIHDASMDALDALLKAQYPNGAWPQRFDHFPDPAAHPVTRAGYPESWSRTWPDVDYRGHYTLNDNSLADMIEVMIEATKVYGDPKYKAAAEKGGGFLILAQMPEPQPAWAQQYDAAMHPAWARKFEPPAVTGGESQEAVGILLQLYRETGEARYLEPVGPALDYLRRSRLPDGRLARFYELRTNRPLYFTKDYRLTESDADMPTHYAFKTPDRTERLVREYQELRARAPGRAEPPLAATRKPALSSKTLEDRVQAAIAALDDQGRWLSSGKIRTQDSPDSPAGKVISTDLFVRNAALLTQYLAATRP
jgi:PelA/Pel-15E family pectate lyase